MTLYHPRALAEILRNTLSSVEAADDMSPDDPALLELRRIVLLKIASLESEHRQAGTTSADTQVDQTLSRRTRTGLTKK